MGRVKNRFHFIAFRKGKFKIKNVTIHKKKKNKKIKQVTLSFIILRALYDRKNKEKEKKNRWWTLK